MRILYDYKIFEQQSVGGVSRYFSEIISCISAEHQIEIALKFSNNQYLANKKLANASPIIDYRGEFIKGVEFKGKGRLFTLIKSLKKEKYPDPYRINYEYAIEILKKQNFDLFHPTTFDPYFLEYIGSKPFVITVHDMIHELYPEYIHKDDRGSEWKKEVVEKAAHIIAVSENTKKDIIELLGVSEDKITVIYHGLPDIIERDSRLDFENYLLYVGERHGYKNFLFLVYSIAELLKEFNIKLVCTGPEFNAVEKRKFTELKIHKNVIHYYAREDELQSLYKNAIAFVCPSLYEGFGLPILEAFACSCPVILSDLSCFREVAGDAAIFFKPKSRREIYDQVKSVIVNSSLRKQLIANGQIRKKIFSWSQTSQKLIDIYNRFS